MCGGQIPLLIGIASTTDGGNVVHIGDVRGTFGYKAQALSTHAGDRDVRTVPDGVRTAIHMVMYRSAQAFGFEGRLRDVDGRGGTIACLSVGFAIIAGEIGNTLTASHGWE